MIITIKGTIEGKKSGSKDGREWTSVQFLDKSRGLRVLDVYLPEGCDHTKLVEGSNVELPVTVSAYNGRVSMNATALSVSASA